ncbi:GatB/YqeY domain-containing protein [Nocardia callitridis]|uniref:Glutamyl-tRNA amidotransferase n=1 Tax=Nocardia callitridis TaxID=648753 RepID=A0ABP9KH91_9NOCA
MSTETVSLRARMRAALTTAMKSRDRQAISALRSALGAIDNAEAVDGTEHRAGAVEDSSVGVGSTEVRRRDLSESDIEQIVRTAIAERRTVADEYDGLGQAEHAAALRAEAETLSALL